MGNPKRGKHCPEQYILGLEFLLSYLAFRMSVTFMRVEKLRGACYVEWCARTRSEKS